MSIVNNSNFNMPSLNGLVDINADSVSSTSISSDEISSKNVDTQTLYVNGVDLGNQVNMNAQKLTGITYTATPTPTTNISSNFNVSQTATFNGPVSTNSTFIAKSIDASNTSVFRSNLNVLGPINGTQNVTFDKDLILTGSGNQFRVFCSSSQFDGSLNVKGVLDVSSN